MNKKTREEAIEELTLMLMYLTRFQDNNKFCKYREVAWKGYDLEALNQLEKREWILQLGKSKCAYMTETGKEHARELLQEYQISDKELYENFIFRNIRQEEAEQAAMIESRCFPANEACTREMMLARIARAPDLFLVAEDRHTGKIAGFLNGLATNEYVFRDEFFENAKLHDEKGKNIMLLGLDVLPEYRRRGLARELMYQYLRRENENGRKYAILTCHSSKVKMYKKMGFCDQGLADSSWGGEQWHEMRCIISL